jgi:hypothetical protein
VQRLDRSARALAEEARAQQARGADVEVVKSDEAVAATIVAQPGP